MGKVLSIVSKPLKEFNLESRAHKVISRDKPVPAPRHKTDVTDYERIKREFPEAYEDGLKKHEDLDKNLKDVFVISTDPQPTPLRENPEKTHVANQSRPLPLDRKTVQFFEFGVKEPTRVPIGRVTLRTALEFITNFQTNPKTYNATKIAEDHVLPEEKVKNILKYFRLFEVYIPEQRQVKANFAGPAISRVKVKTMPRAQLRGPQNAEDTDKKKDDT